MLRYLKIKPRDRSSEQKFIDEKALYKTLKKYCTKSTRIIEAGPGVGPWTPILLEHIAHETGLAISWGGIEKEDRQSRDENEYSDGVVVNQDICTLPYSLENADLALSIRPRAYGYFGTPEEAQLKVAKLINEQHRKLLSLLRTGGHLIILIIKGEYELVRPFWIPPPPGCAFAGFVDAGLNNILVIKKL